MKKVLMIVCAALMSAVFFVGSASAGPSIDQSYYKAGDGSLAIKAQSIAVQSFRPLLSNLDRVEVNLANANGTANCGVDKYNGTDWDPVRYINGQTVVDGWNTFDFEDVNVTVGDRYRIWLEVSTTDTQWYYGTQEPNGPYDRGAASWGPGYTLHANTDFHFRTWGTDPVEIIAENTQVNANANTNSAVAPAGQSVGTGTAPAATTSSSIKVASGLTALYSNNAANLNWTKSTSTDIDGYKIFRSEAEATGFTEIGKTVKATAEYIDTKDLVAAKTYYYFVRAYKGTLESASTSTVSLLIPETVAEPTSDTANIATSISTTDTDDMDFATTCLYWISGWIIASLLVILLAYEMDHKKKGKFAGAKHFKLLK